jgi:hypothetical protein
MSRTVLFSVLEVELSFLGLGDTVLPLNGLVVL